jgi:hypothetical protein
MRRIASEGWSAGRDCLLWRVYRFQAKALFFKLRVALLHHLHHEFDDGVVRDLVPAARRCAISAQMSGFEQTVNRFHAALQDLRRPCRVDKNRGAKEIEAAAAAVVGGS